MHNLPIETIQLYILKRERERERERILQLVPDIGYLCSTLKLVSSVCFGFFMLFVAYSHKHWLWSMDMGGGKILKVGYDMGTRNMWNLSKFQKPDRTSWLDWLNELPISLYFGLVLPLLTPLTMGSFLKVVWKTFYNCM